MNKIKDRDKAIIFVLIGIIFLAAAYFLGFKLLFSKANDYHSKNVTLAEEVKKLENMDAKKGDVLEQTAQSVANVESILEKYPEDQKVENIIADYHDMCESIKGVEISAEAFNMNLPFYTGRQGVLNAADGTSSENETADTMSEGDEVTISSTDNAASDLINNSLNYTGNRSEVDLTFNSTYDSMKKVVNYINENKEKMNIAEFNCVVGDSTRQLTTTLKTNIYSFQDTGREYKAPVLDSEREGRTNLYSFKAR
ncbi:MAG: hypothetical protein K6D02_05650 [Lachnospiraceae bacterium]|nr:hypothetical protein [Lachnospiraceae bacterium]